MFKKFLAAALIGWCAWTALAHAMQALKDGVHLHLSIDAKIE